MKNLIRAGIRSILNQLFLGTNIRIIGTDLESVEHLIIEYVSSALPRYSREMCICETKAILQEPDIHTKVINTFLK